MIHQWISCLAWYALCSLTKILHSSVQCIACQWSRQFPIDRQVFCGCIHLFASQTVHWKLEHPVANWMWHLWFKCDEISSFLDKCIPAMVFSTKIHIFWYSCKIVVTRIEWRCKTNEIMGLWLEQNLLAQFSKLLHFAFDVFSSVCVALQKPSHN